MTDLTPIRICREIPSGFGSPVRSGQLTIWGPDTDKAQVILTAPQRGWKAELLDENGKDAWFWVCECPSCTGVWDVPYFVNKCVEHDVCVQCATPRSELTEIPWGHVKGFMCKPCDEHNRKMELAVAMSVFRESKHDDFYFEYNNEIVCPHCGTKHDTDGDDYGADGDEFERECRLCEKTYTVIVNLDVTWSTKKVE